MKTAILDYTSGFSSFLCAIHCIALPFVVAFLPAMGLTFLSSEAFGEGMIVFTLIFGLWAIVSGSMEHKKCWPLVWFGFGILTLLFSEYILHDMIVRKEIRFGNTMRMILTKGHPAHHYVSALGGFLVVIAHMLNRFFCKKCTHSCCSAE